MFKKEKANGRYVLLTGNLNNSGDFLIGHRTKALLQKFKPEIKITEYDMWKKMTNEQVENVNNSKALIIAGGPGMVSEIAKIHCLDELQNKIHMPIILMGLGQYNSGTSFEDFSLDFQGSDLELIKRLEKSEYKSGVRDFKTLNALKKAGFNNFSMTGCPVLYDVENIEKDFVPLKKDEIKKVVFSLGVKFTSDLDFDIEQKNLILKAKDYFYDADFIVALHHSTKKEDFKASYGCVNQFFEGMQNMVQWLDEKGIKYIDISGGCEKMIELYKNNCDFHLGYRVHAHVLLTSSRKMSILISEDGRGVGMNEVIGTKTPLSGIDNIFDYIDNEFKTDCKNFMDIKSLRKYYIEMAKFIEQLP